MAHEVLNQPSPVEPVAPVPRAFGLIMLKPDALRSVFDPLVMATFSGSVQNIFQRPDCQFVDDLDKVTLCGSYYRDLSVVPYGRRLLHLFYRDLSAKRYFPLINECYFDRTAFLLLGYAGNQNDMDQFLTAVKGQAETYDARGEVATSPQGVRGALTVPYRFYSRDEGRTLSDGSYREAFAPVVNNSIHVCDNPGETAAALSHLLSPHDFATLETLGYPVAEFMTANHDPVTGPQALGRYVLEQAS